MWDAAGGSEWRTLSLYEELRGRCRVSLWSEFEPDPRLPPRYPVRRISAPRLSFPKTGTFVFVGVYFPVGSWIGYALPRRVVIVYNTFQPGEFARALRRLSRRLRPEVEVVYASEALREATGQPGVLHASLVDLDKFAPAEPRPAAAFTVGRLSRDEFAKHHAEDAALYRRLVEHGCRVEVMGASSYLFAQVGCSPGITLLPTCAREPHLFLRGLDCFFYRTSEWLCEASGRVVSEAMACGLPVVCHRRGGYAAWIDHGRNGFLFDTQEEALRLLLALRDDAELRRSVGRAARATAEEMFSAAARSEIADYFLRRAG